MASDIEIDVPMLWDYISKILAPILVNFTENRKTFILDCIEFCESEKRPKFVAKIFKAISEFTVRVDLFLYLFIILYIRLGKSINSLKYFMIHHMFYDLNK